MRASQFHTRQKHEEGTKVFIPLPDGTETEEFVVLQGADSGPYRKAQAEYRDRMFKAKVDDKEFDSLAEGRKLTAFAIKSWSLEDPLTQEAAIELLTEAPYLLDKFDQVIQDPKRFFVGKE